MLRMRAWMMGGSVLALAGLVWLAGRGLAGDDEKAQHMKIQKIADSLKTNKEQAQKMAAEMGKKVEYLDIVMHGFKPRKRGGFGVGKTPGALTPDGIELKILQLQRDGITNAALNKEAEALEEMARITAAIGEVTRHYESPDFGKGKKMKKEWVEHTERMIEGSQKLAAAAKAKEAANVKTAAKMVNDACNACHATFRE